MGNNKFHMNAIITGLSLSNDYCFVYVFTHEFDNDNKRSDEIFILAKRKNCKIHFLLSDPGSNLQQRATKIRAIEQMAFETLGMKVNIPNNNLYSIIKLITYTLNIHSIPILLI
ncbi:unnamed protein product [Rotaria sp. Silwood2]|nr:unnamed protein product [Rotaria sp. Silwood2]CAF4437800.1 unnamed protein product [Rotaria sp. Silwood2]